MFQTVFPVHHQELKIAHRASGIVRPILLPAAAAASRQSYYYSCTVIVINIKHLWIRLSALFPVKKSAERINQFSFR